MSGNPVRGGGNEGICRAPVRVEQRPRRRLSIISSVGRITGPGTGVSIAVPSHDNGTRSVQKVAKLTRQHLKY